MPFDNIHSVTPGALVVVLVTVPALGAFSNSGRELTVSVVDGPSTVGPVAVALQGAGVVVRSLTLRTPTLDDVFLELTGGHLQGAEDDADRPDEPAPEPAGRRGPR